LTKTIEIINLAIVIKIMVHITLYSSTYSVFTGFYLNRLISNLIYLSRFIVGVSNDYFIGPAVSIIVSFNTKLFLRT